MRYCPKSAAQVKADDVDDNDVGDAGDDDGIVGDHNKDEILMILMRF